MYILILGSNTFTVEGDMGQEYLAFAVSLIGLITVFVMLLNFRSNRIANVYLIFIFAYISIFALIWSSYHLEIQNFISPRSLGVKPLLVFIFPCFYLYFKTLYRNKNIFYSTDLFHFLIPASFLVSLGMYKELVIQSLGIDVFFYVAYSLISLTYLGLSIREWWITFYKSERRTSNDMGHWILIKEWTFFLITIYFILNLRVFLIVYSELFTGKLSALENYIWIAALLWLGVFLKALISPELLFGYAILRKKMTILDIETETEVAVESSLVLDNWNLERDSEITNVQDRKLSAKVIANLERYILVIEKAVLENHVFQNPKYDLQMLAMEVKVPKSHLTYLFKYHSTLFFPEFKNMVQIKDTEKYIAQGFLATSTLEALSLKVGFSSYSPFFVAFKRHTGYSPQDYRLKE
ncbi:MAG: hypothetical protein COA50_16435 [Flavobacteriaceae bacterium]|nr:MAG: hypothetical protein COA50_16435 [Flavobacteriaceae bacterium]